MENKEILTSIIENVSLDSLAIPEVLVLDLDLTLHDVIEHYDEAFNETLAHFGAKSVTHEEISNNFISTKYFFAQFLPEDKLEKAMEYYLNHFLLREIPVNSLLPGAEELLSLVKHELQIPIIGITNSEEIVAKKILQDLGVLEFFDYVIGIKEGNIPKPNKQMLLKSLESVSVIPGPYIWFVGDSYSDTKCAKDSGCTAVRYYHKNKPIDENADIFINCHFNLFAMMKAKCGKVF